MKQSLNNLTNKPTTMGKIIKQARYLFYLHTLELLGYCVCSELLERIEYRFIFVIVVGLFVKLLSDFFI